MSEERDDEALPSYAEAEGIASSLPPSRPPTADEANNAASAGEVAQERAMTKSEEVASERSRALRM